VADKRGQGGRHSGVGVLQRGDRIGIVRFCFAKQDDTLRLALARLATL
jgi:hypothetical protein